MSIKQKQVLGVTAMVALVVTALSLLHLVTLARVLLNESRARAELLSNGIYHQARDIITSRETAAAELRSSRNVQSALESATIFSQDVADAVIVDAGNTVLASSDPAQVGQTVQARVPLNNILAGSGLAQVRAIYATGQILEWSQPIALGDEPFGEIRVGLWTLLVRDDLNDSLAPAALAAGVSLLVAVVVAMLLAQLVLRPMHVIRSSLTRLGRGDLGATLDLRNDEELRDLGDVFDQVSAQLRAASPGGLSPAQLGEMSRRITRVGRLFTGVAHEMKNPLNAMTIHIELLRAKLDAASPAFPHLDVIAGEIRKLDDRIQGFLKFVRPEEVSFGPVPLAPLIGNVLATVGPEADRAGVTIHPGCSDPALLAEGDAAQLRDVFLNLAQNAIQAMPKGGRLSMVCSALPDHRVSVRVEDTGVGIAPENLERIFELYFTTKDRGSGMGLALAFRAVQIHNGSIDVESTVGVGTAFIVVLPAGELVAP
ncbi:MAG: ATP-binding protein [Acidobacteriota bacterium]|nr:ATP-binding protein [Acidobacteriota bacterium]